MTELRYLPYPTPERQENGCKVSWLIYDKIEDAMEAAKAAYHNAQLDASLGYDFGFQTPGKITVEDNQFRVCIS